MMQFSFKELEEYAVEEGLHQAVVMKLSYGAPELQELRNLIPTQFGIKGRCLIGLLAFRQLLIRCDVHDDFVTVLSKQEENLIDSTVDNDRVLPAEVLALAEEISKVENLQGDARDYLNAKSQQKANVSSCADIPVDGPQSAAVNATDKVGSGDAGQHPVSGAIVPVAEALDSVAQDLKATKNSVVDRGLSGESKGSAIESGQLHQTMDDSALAAIFDKNNAAVAEIGQGDKVDKRPGPVDSRLEANVALNTIGSRPNARVIKTTAAQDTAVQDEDQEIEDDVLGSTVATDAELVVGYIDVRQEQTNIQQVQGAKKKGTGIVEAIDALKDGVKSDNIAEKKAENWTIVSSKNGSPNNTNVQQLEQRQGVVNRSSNKRYSGVKEQATTPKNIEFSNSFDALRNEQEHVMNMEGKSIQQVLMDEPILDDIATTMQQRDREAASKSGMPKSPGSLEQHIFS
ncbi:hypothetical protein A4A49_48878 [Nicotiana attenuata]|uniref:Uncharacterized protein n=1 Tax=Nicotiana attenuata TaxID=49451 RepID=A0A314L7F4_NICAT|nr:hypothetical protein A4A49_48878 [Nicotiana attenuata]